MKTERTTAAILNEPFELCGIPRVPAAIIALIVAVLWWNVAWKVAAVSFIGLTLGVKQLYKWDRDFLLLIPAIVFFFIHRVFDPFEWEPFGIVIVEDARYEED
jgi:hypothetical protein